MWGLEQRAEQRCYPAEDWHERCRMAMQRELSRRAEREETLLANRQDRQMEIADAVRRDREERREAERLEARLQRRYPSWRPFLCS